MNILKSIVVASASGSVLAASLYGISLVQPSPEAERLWQPIAKDVSEVFAPYGQLDNISVHNNLGAVRTLPDGTRYVFSYGTYDRTQNCVTVTADFSDGRTATTQMCTHTNLPEVLYFNHNKPKKGSNVDRAAANGLKLLDQLLTS